MSALLTGPWICRTFHLNFCRCSDLITNLSQRPPKPDHTKLVALSTAGAILIVVAAFARKSYLPQVIVRLLSSAQYFGMPVVITHISLVKSVSRRTRLTRSFTNIPLALSSSQISAMLLEPVQYSIVLLVPFNQVKCLLLWVPRVPARLLS